MSAVVVFVDDAVRGWLPSVCAKDGVPTADRIVIHEQIGSSSLGLAWILLLLGPLGWVGLLLVAASRGRDEMLTVQVPLCDDDYGRLVMARRTRTAWVLAAVAAVLVWLVLSVVQVGNVTSGRGWVLAGLVAFAAFALGAIQAQWRLGRQQIGVGLDASRRWVTLSGVDSRFAAAVEAGRSRSDRS